jgi:hypothetical protein
MSDYEGQEPIVEPMEEYVDEDLRDGEESLVDAFVRHQRTAYEETKLAFDALIPEGFREHGREAKRAFKRSFKVILSEIVEQIDTTEEPAPARPKTTGKTKVKVEVS